MPSDDSMMPTSTYQGCDCETCKELNVDCPDCPVCSKEEMDSEVAMAMYDSLQGKSDSIFAGLGKDYTRSTTNVYRTED